MIDLQLGPGWMEIRLPDDGRGTDEGPSTADDGPLSGDELVRWEDVFEGVACPV